MLTEGKFYKHNGSELCFFLHEVIREELGFVVMHVTWYSTATFKRWDEFMPCIWKTTYDKLDGLQECVPNWYSQAA